MHPFVVQKVTVAFYCCYFNILMSLLNKSQVTFSTIYNKQVLIFKFKISSSWTSTHLTCRYSMFIVCSLTHLSSVEMGNSQPAPCLCQPTRWCVDEWKRPHFHFPGIYLVESASRVNQNTLSVHQLQEETSQWHVVFTLQSILLVILDINIIININKLGHAWWNYDNC